MKKMFAIIVLTFLLNGCNNDKDKNAFPTNQNVSGDKFKIEKILEDPFFGTPVDDDSSSGMITKAIHIKRHSREIEQLVRRDQEAVRFYCKNDCMYAFSKQNLLALVNSLKDSTSCAIIYVGSRKDDDPEYKQGRPTLIISAYDYDSVSRSFKLNKKPFEKSDMVALEHPGGDGRLFPERRGTKFYLKESIPLTDFRNVLLNKNLKEQLEELE